MACSGCGISPTTLPAALQMPAMSRATAVRDCRRGSARRPGPRPRTRRAWLVGDVAALAVLERDDDLLARSRSAFVQQRRSSSRCAASGRGRRSAGASLRISAPGSRCASQSTWKPLQMPEHRQAVAGLGDDRVHHRARTGRSRRHAGSRRRRSRRAGPPRRRRAGRRRRATADTASAPASRTARCRIAVVERAREGDNTDGDGHLPSTGARRGDGQRNVKFSMTGLASRVSASFVSELVVDGAVDVELEMLAPGARRDTAWIPEPAERADAPAPGGRGSPA